MQQIEFNEVAKADLLRLDKQVRDRILRFLLDRVAPHPAPEQIAEPLVGEFKGYIDFVWATTESSLTFVKTN